MLIFFSPAEESGQSTKTLWSFDDSTSSSVRYFWAFQNSLSLLISLDVGILLLLFDSDSRDSYSERKAIFLLELLVEIYLLSMKIQFQFINVKHYTIDFQILNTIMSLLCLFISNHSSSEVYYQYNNSSVKKNLKDDVKMVASKAKFLKSRVGERDILRSDNGNWYLLRGQESLLFAACANQDYPERLVYGLIQKLQTTIKEKQTKKDISKRISSLSKQLSAQCEKYKDAKADKVKQAQHVVGQLKDELQKGVRKMIENTDNLGELNEKTNLMKNYAKSFQKTAEVAEKKFFWQKWRYYIIVGIVLAISFTAAGIIIYFKNH